MHKLCVQKTYIHAHGSLSYLCATHTHTRRASASHALNPPPPASPLLKILGNIQANRHFKALLRTLSPPELEVHSHSSFLCASVTALLAGPLGLFLSLSLCFSPSRSPGPYRRGGHGSLALYFSLGEEKPGVHVGHSGLCL